MTETERVLSHFQKWVAENATYFKVIPVPGDAVFAAYAQGWKAQKEWAARYARRAAGSSSEHLKGTP